MKRNNVFTIVNSLLLKQIQSNQKESLIEIRKSDKELQCVRPQIRDHSNKVLASRFFSISMGLSMSSKVWALHSFQTNHIRHAGTIFQTFEEWVPNQFLQAKRRETIVSAITHWTPNIMRTSLHKADANLQWSKRWSTVSSSHLQRQHQFTKLHGAFAWIFLYFNHWYEFIGMLLPLNVYHFLNA